MRIKLRSRLTFEPDMKVTFDQHKQMVVKETKAQRERKDVLLDRHVLLKIRLKQKLYGW
jgi:hypothetical protein